MEADEGTLMKQHYLVMYDITDGRRLQKVGKICSGFGDRIQYSVFHCSLTDADLERLKLKLKPFIQNDDQVLFMKLRPMASRRNPFAGRVESLGRPFRNRDTGNMIV